jgi:hypothetical protein
MTTQPHFIQMVSAATTDEDYEALAKRVHADGNPARIALASVIQHGSDEACRKALIVALGACATHNTHIESALITVLSRADTSLHDLALPALIERAAAGRKVVTEALAKYISREDISCAVRYAETLRLLGLKPKDGFLPRTKVVARIGTLADAEAEAI